MYNTPLYWYYKYFNFYEIKNYCSVQRRHAQCEEGMTPLSALLQIISFQFQLYEKVIEPAVTDRVGKRVMREEQLSIL